MQQRAPPGVRWQLWTTTTTTTTTTVIVIVVVFVIALSHARTNVRSYLSDSLGVDADVSVQAFKWLQEAAGFNISEELLVRCPFTDASVMHMITAKSDDTRFLDEVVRFARESLASRNRDDPNGGGGGDDDDDSSISNKAFVAVMREAMLVPLAPWSFTPMHVAAMRWGARSAVYRRLLELDAKLLGGSAVATKDAFGLRCVRCGAA